MNMLTRRSPQLRGEPTQALAASQNPGAPACRTLCGISDEYGASSEGNSPSSARGSKNEPKAKDWRGQGLLPQGFSDPKASNTDGFAEPLPITAPLDPARIRTAKKCPAGDANAYYNLVANRSLGVNAEGDGATPKQYLLITESTPHVRACARRPPRSIVESTVIQRDR
jgi:hypothetical protein